MKTQLNKSGNGSKNKRVLIVITLLCVFAFTIGRLPLQVKHEPVNVALHRSGGEKPAVSEPVFEDIAGVKNDQLIFPVGELPPMSAEQKARYKVIPPLPSMAEKPVIKNVRTNEGALLKYASGTQIIIPPEAFVDKKGKAVEGDVELAYKEFRNAFDIFISGIPMKYDSGGKSLQFESAGMMELTASLNNEPVFINPLKKIKINLASEAGDTDYNLYYFDAKKGNWVNKGKDAVKKQIEKQEPVVAVEKKKKSVRKMYAYESMQKGISRIICTDYHHSRRAGFLTKNRIPGEFIFRFSNTIFKSYPELKSFSNIRWKYNNADAEFVYTQLFGKKLKKDQPVATSDFWSGVSLQHENNTDEFVMTFYSEKDSLMLNVEPASYKRNQASASKSDMKRYNSKYDRYLSELEKQITNEKLRYSKYQSDSVEYVNMADEIVYNPTLESQLVRSFSIDGFGIWNCDRELKGPDLVTLRINFTDVEGNVLPLRNVYHVDKRKNSVMTYYSSELQKFKMNPGAENVIWAVLPDNRLAYVSPMQLASIKKGERRHTFQMKVLNDAEEGMKELRRVFNI
ncbi:MAG: hypothetical protein ACHQNT_11560 [Bacteroidia bacterium]